MAIDGLKWPGLPGPHGQILMSLLYQLEQSQWWSAEKLLSHQFQQLGILLAHARKTVPYYERILDQAGYDPTVPLTKEVWSRIPVLGRKDMQANTEELTSSRIPKQHGSINIVTSSGSTGTPVVAHKTQLCQRFWEVVNLRDHAWHDRDLGNKMAVIRSATFGPCPYPDGAHSRVWSRAIASVFPTGPACMLDISSKVHEQAEWLQRQDPEYLVTYPSNLSALIHHGSRHGLTLPRLKQVRTMNEMLLPDVREACRDVWGVEIADMYSCEEAGYLALQCAEQSTYHIQSETVMLEILDESGQQCEPGQTGQVVVTPLHNFAMPLIRYAIGDMAVVGEACACGRGLPVLERIDGRIRTLVKLPNGELFRPTYHRLLEGFDTVAQFQIVRQAETALLVNLVAPKPLSAGQEAELGQRILDRFKYPFAISFAYMDEIPRGPGGKFETYVA